METPHQTKSRIAALFAEIGKQVKDIADGEQIAEAIDDKDNFITKQAALIDGCCSLFGIDSNGDSKAVKTKEYEIEELKPRADDWKYYRGLWYSERKRNDLLRKAVTALAKLLGSE